MDLDKYGRHRLAFKRKKERYDETVNWYRCGWWTHKKKECKSQCPDCNKDNIPFHRSEKGQQWMSNVKYETLRK
jgi:rubrerythrin